jgi:hypothetical protein
MLHVELIKSINNQLATYYDKASFSVASDSRLLTSDNCFFTN